MKINNPIKQHLIDTDENYIEHFSFAFKNGSRLILVASALIIHSVLPCFFKTTASKNVSKMNEIFNDRRNQAQIRKANKK